MKNFTVPINVAIHSKIMSVVADNFVFIQDTKTLTAVELLSNFIEHDVKGNFKKINKDAFFTSGEQGECYIKGNGEYPFNMGGIEKIEPTRNGIRIRYKTGIVLSSTFAFGSYCSNRDLDFVGDYKKLILQTEWESPDCEIAILYKGDWLTQLFYRDHSDDVVGFVTLPEWCSLVEFLRKIKNIERFIQDNALPDKEE